VLRGVAGCFGVLQGVARCCQKVRHTVLITLSSHYVAECCSTLQRVAGDASDIVLITSSSHFVFLITLHHHTVLQCVASCCRPTRCCKRHCYDSIIEALFWIHQDTRELEFMRYRKTCINVKTVFARVHAHARLAKRGRERERKERERKRDSESV